MERRRAKTQTAPRAEQVRSPLPVLPPPLAGQAAALEAAITARRADKLDTEAWEQALAAIYATAARQDVAWETARAGQPEVYNARDPKHNLPAPAFLHNLIAFARRREQPTCQRCLGRWGRREMPVRITNAEGDALLIHDMCVVEDDNLE